MFYSHCHLLHQLAYKAFNPWFSQFYLCNHGLWLNRHHRKKSQIASVSKVSRVDSRDFWFLCWSLDFFRHPFRFFRSLKLEYFSLQIVQAEEWEWFFRHESGRKNSKIAYLYKYIPAYRHPLHQDYLWLNITPDWSYAIDLCFCSLYFYSQRRLGRYELSNLWAQLWSIICIESSSSADLQSPQILAERSAKSI